MKSVFVIIIFFFIRTTNAQTYVVPKIEKNSTRDQLFEESYATLKSMLNDNSKYSFKKAVFSVENAYLNGKLDTTFINKDIKMLKNLSITLINNRTLKYSESDKADVVKWAAVYQVMSDTIPFLIKEKGYQYIPYHYDFNDVFGNQDITNMFVSKLLTTRKGNCHSLPYLYKIICEELGTTAHLALAPNHIYIKHRNRVNGWYNTELTSGVFPEDAWLMASGYIHIDAIKNGVYMKALNNDESIALVMIDLANAYQKTFPDNDGSFLLKCTNAALKAYPNFATALILKAELLKNKVKGENNLKKAENDFKSLQKEYIHIHALGYRFMPEDMYLQWLTSLQTERAKYENQKMTTFNKQ